jgi:SAM-dependent methyltransferase
MKDKKILHLGCGKTKIPGAIGIDIVKIPGSVEIVHDLNSIPYPFKANTIEEIHMYHVLEHLDYPLKVIEELHRILALGGVLHIRVPHFSSMGAFSDITHKRPFGVTSFDCFIKDHYHHFYTTVSFKILKREIKYLGLYPNDGVYEKYIHKNQCPLLIRPFIKLLNWLINFSPMVFERIWCYWVGGATEVVIDLQK